MAKVVIKGVEVELRYTIKGLILFEGVKAQAPNSGNIFDAMALVWSFLRAEIDRKKLDLNLTLDDFIDWIDEDKANYKRCIEWLNEAQEREADVLGSEGGDEKKSQP